MSGLVQHQRGTPHPGDDQRNFSRIRFAGIVVAGRLETGLFRMRETDMDVLSLRVIPDSRPTIDVFFNIRFSPGRGSEKMIRAAQIGDVAIAVEGNQ